MAAATLSSTDARFEDFDVGVGERRRVVVRVEVR